MLSWSVETFLNETNNNLELLLALLVYQKTMLEVRL